MDDSKFLNQIGELIDKKLDPIKQDVNGIKEQLDTVKEQLDTVKEQLDTVKEQLDTVEIKVELVNKKVEKTEQNLAQAIKDSQIDTITTLSELIHTGYNLHEARIKKLEELAKTPQIQ